MFNPNSGRVPFAFSEAVRLVSSSRVPLASTLCILAMLVGGASFAQTTGSGLRGRVADENGRPVVAAVVQARSAESGTIRTAVTDDKGVYRIDEIQSGIWTVVARVPGGEASESRTVTLSLQKTLELDFVTTGGIEERITVSANARLLDPKQTSGEVRFNLAQTESLPLAGRSFTDLALLDAAVRRPQQGNYFGERGAVFVINGQSGRANSFLVDGLDNNDQVSGTTSNSFFSQLTIREFVVLKSQFSAEFGRAVGGVTNAVTRRGANEQSWSVLMQGTTHRTNSTGEFVENLPNVGASFDAPNRLQLGASVGGAFRKDKAFYFFAFEHQSGKELTSYTGFDRTGTPGGFINSPTENDSIFFRTDFNLGASNQLMFRLSANDRSDTNINVGGIRTPENGFGIDEQDISLSGSLKTIVSPKMINEVRWQIATSEFDQRANSDLSGVERPRGIFGGNQLQTQDRDETRFQLVENMTFRRGRHSIKVGFDIIRSQTDLLTSFNNNGGFLYVSDIPFESGDCDDLQISEIRAAEIAGTLPFVACPGQVGVDDDMDTVIDEPAIITSFPQVFSHVSGEPAADLDDTRYALFVQDQWEVTDRWFLDYGIRYDISTYTLSEGVALDSPIPNGGAGKDTDNWAPRMAFTYNAGKNRKTVIRAGAGVFYDKLALGFPAVAAITSGTEIGLFFPQGFAVELTEQSIADDGIDSILPSLFFFDQLTLRFSTDTKLETPYTLQWKVGIQHRFNDQSSFGVEFNQSRGHDMTVLLDLNPVTGIFNPGTECSAMFQEPLSDDTIGLPCHLRDPALGSIAALTSRGRNWYTGLDFNFRHQAEDRWLNLSYTWSDAEDTGFDPLKGGIALPPNGEDLSGERGRSDSDVRHRLVLSGDVPIPWWNVRVSGAFQAASALPYEIITGSDFNLDGQMNDRPDGIARNAGADADLEIINQVRADYNADIAPLFVTDPSLELPMISSLPEPWLFQVDVRLYRQFRLGSGTRGEMFLQVFNLFDRNNIGRIEGRIISRDFGSPVSLAGPPRTVEFGLRIGR